MANPEMRHQTHKKVAESKDEQLNTTSNVLSVSTRYSKDALNTFYQRAKEFEENGSQGFSIEESHSLIRNKYKQGDL